MTKTNERLRLPKGSSMTPDQCQNLLDALTECLEARRHYDAMDHELPSLAGGANPDDLDTPENVEVVLTGLRANNRRRRAVRRAHAAGASLALAGRFVGVSNATAHRWWNGFMAESDGE
ncbi:hypothetical protein [Candidatus Poriferisodalis sp.]|uniref:hypothetical protein n=1 Tax=Candidatus Poriferisodalis sp. TaxID=3101277 RepID=UPI003B02B00C